MRLLFRSCFGLFLAAFIVAGEEDKTAQISGYVKDAAGRPIRGATVILTLKGTSTHFEVGTGSVKDDKGGAEGKYQSPSLPKGTYTLRLEKPGFAPLTRTDLDLDKNQNLQLDFILYPAFAPLFEDEHFVVALVAFLYLLGIWTIKWHNIALPNRKLLLTQIDVVESRLVTEVDPGRTAEIEVLRKLLEDARKTLPKWPNPFDIIFWTRGQEIAAWGSIHEVERQIINLLAPASSKARVLARLQSVEQELRATDKAPAKALAELIKRAWDCAQPDENTMKQFLGEALAFLYDDRDTGYATLITWQNKAMWMTGSGFLIIVTLGESIGRSPLFLAGAAGGFLSRLARTLKREDVPSDYGASWSTLFLSPILGAMAAWFGILLIVMLSDPSLKILGEAFRSIPYWENPIHPFALGLAFLLGFSERFFDGIVAAVDDHVISQEKAASKAPVITPPPHPPPAKEKPVPDAAAVEEANKAAAEKASEAKG